ncbi:MAG: DNA polymerase I [Thermodesulfobacteriales bacterium]|nr:MAG: DNA polymerase I [Thermodesulfobacteriales bacterium]
MEKPILYLIDGSSYIFRAYYAIRHLSNSKGIPTNAVYGFTAMLFKFLKDYEPTHLGIVFDSKGKTFRDDIYPLYKANRSAPPEDLAQQFSMIFEMVDAFNIPQVQLEGFEADDLMGTIAKDVQKEDANVVLVTGDKDFCQLVSDKVTLLDTMKNKITGIPEVKEKYGVAPERVIDVFALAGDAVDNIPGVKGIGEKTAVSLISKFGSLDELFNNLDGVSKRQKVLIEEKKEDAVLSKELVTIKTDVDIETRLDKFKYNGFDDDKLRQIFQDLEFKNLLRELGDEGSSDNGDADESTVSYDEYQLVLSEDHLDRVISKIKETGELSIDLETTSPNPMLANIVGVALCPAPHESYYVPVAHRALTDSSTKQLDLSLVLDKLKPIVESQEIAKIGQNLKYEIVVLEKYGLKLNGISFDTMIAAHMIDSSRNSYSLDELCRLYLGHQMISYKDVTGTGKSKINFDEVELEVARDYASEDADVAMLLSRILAPKLDEINLMDVFRDIELKFIKVLAKVEMNGVHIDSDKLKELSKEFESLLKQIEKDIFSEVGYEFNLNSPLQLREVLFETLNLPQKKQTKKGEPSTDVEVLTDLSKFHLVPEKVLEHRTLSKLKSTYIDSLPKLINPDTGRIHTSFNPVGSSTGRLSSSDPNLQNIPIKSAQGRRIREAFIPEEGYTLLSADYSQIELRLLAHFSKDDNLVEAFLNDSDIHNRTAAEIFGVTEDLVTPDMRRLSKNINFGIIYGISAFGLAKQLGTSIAVSKSYIDEYFKRYGKVKEYIEKSIMDAQSKGYAETILGRRRPIPELQSNNRGLRGFGERTAMNTPIQGSAADIINIAMIRINDKMVGYKSSLILQVHDELLFEVKKDELEKLSKMVKEEMEGAWKLIVPIKVDMGSGDNWAEAH